MFLPQIASSNKSLQVTGGDLITTINVSGQSYKVHQFYNSANFTVIKGVPTTVETLIVAGGGGAGSQTASGVVIATATAGGNGGGVVSTTTTISPNTYPVIVGAGGAAHSDGNNSSFNGLIALKGGLGSLDGNSFPRSLTAADYGSYGENLVLYRSSSTTVLSGGLTTRFGTSSTGGTNTASNQGYIPVTPVIGVTGSNYVIIANGGAGAGGTSIIGAWTSATSTASSSKGGPGFSSDITGNTYRYGAGGGGGMCITLNTGANHTIAGLTTINNGGGLDGGAPGTIINTGGADNDGGTGASANANSGGGGGGAAGRRTWTSGSVGQATMTGGAGGSGIVIIRYPV